MQASRDVFIGIKEPRANRPRFSIRKFTQFAEKKSPHDSRGDQKINYFLRKRTTTAPATRSAPNADAVAATAEPQPPDTGSSFSSALTVTVHVAVFPFLVVTVIVAVPAFTAVTFPFSSTVATVSSEVVHSTASSAPDGAIVAASVSLAPTESSIAV